MECRTPNDIYLLLKASDFITHDLEHAFDGCVDSSSPPTPTPTPSNQEANSSTAPSSQETGSVTPTPPPASAPQDRIPYTLILRKTVPSFNPACEFRCFVRDRRLLCLCQRDLNHYDFLFPMVPRLRALIQGFFDEKLRDSFPDACFVFDVYVPAPHGRVWLVDVNAWAPRTDPLLFSWGEVIVLNRISHEL